jgi:hypothetical protein
MPDLDALFDRVSVDVRSGLAQADGRVVGLRIRVGGAGALHRDLSARSEAVVQQLRAVTLDASGGNAWLEKVELRVHPPIDIDRLSAGDDPVGLLVRELKALAQDQERLSAFAGDALRELKQKLPADLNLEEDLRLDAPDVLRELLREAEGELLARLAGERGAQ